MTKYEEWKVAGCPLTMEEDLLKLKTPILNGYKHKRENRTLVKAAYNEMRIHQGKKPKSMDCASCKDDINKLLSIWFKIHESRSKHQIEQGKIFIKRFTGLKDTGDILKGSGVDGGLITNDERRDHLNKLDFRSELIPMIKDLPKASQDHLKGLAKKGVNKKADIINEILKH